VTVARAAAAAYTGLDDEHRHAFDIRYADVTYDPHCSTATAVRVFIDGVEVHLLVHEDEVGDDPSTAVEEVEYTTWPPTSSV
jgi:hypothetical protein